MNISFAIKTHGCKVNQYESQSIRESLVKLGCSEVDVKEADVIIVNSCTVTGDADSKVRSTIRLMNKENPRARILVTGCYAVMDEDVASLKILPGVADLVNNKDKSAIPRIIGAIKNENVHTSVLDEGVSGFASHARAFLKVQDGCDQACAYCKVSIVRGPSVSRMEADVIKEFELLVSKGLREIVLTGICLGAWQGENGRIIADLIERIEAVEGDFRARISSIEPNYVTGRFISVMSSSAKICRHLHIPLQSGSDNILALMKRRYNTEQFRELVAGIRKAMPLCGITMDVITGFPGETDEDFDRTLRFINEIRPSGLHVFGYSDRKGTAAHDMKNKVDPMVAKARRKELEKAAGSLKREFAEAFVGKTVDVLIEKVNDGTATGYTGEYLEARLEGFARKRGDIAKAVIGSVDPQETILIANFREQI